MITKAHEYAVERIAHAFILADEIHSTAESLKPWSEKITLSKVRDYPIDQTALFHGLEDMLLKTKDLLETHISFYANAEGFAHQGNGSQLGYPSRIENQGNHAQVFDALQIKPSATGTELQNLVTSIGRQAEQYLQSLINQLANVDAGDTNRAQMLTTLDISMDIVKTFMELIAKGLKSLYGYIER